MRSAKQQKRISPGAPKSVKQRAKEILITRLPELLIVVMLAISTVTFLQTLDQVAANTIAEVVAEVLE